MTHSESANATKQHSGAESAEKDESAGTGPDRDSYLRTIVETTPECIEIIARDGRIVRMNAAGLAMIGANTFARVESLPACDLVAP